MIARIRLHLELVAFAHTVFALPFALLGAVLAVRGLPPAPTLAWTVVAVVGARTAAMAVNRIADLRFDARNPRTSRRTLVRGAVAPREAGLLALGSAALFVGACAALGPGALALSGPTLAIALGYSWTKRITSWSHVVLGGALALAPLGGWIAARGLAAGYPWALSLGVLLWVAGFDVVYACQDEAFDRAAGLHSIPQRWGARRALLLARAFHLGALLAFAQVGLDQRLGPAYAAGLVLAAAALLVQHALAGGGDPSRVQSSFLATNGTVSLVLLASACGGLALG